MNKENGEYEYLSSRHATPIEEESFLHLTPPTSTAPVFGHVVVKGGLWGLLPGRIIGDEEAKKIPPKKISRHIPHDPSHWIAAEYDPDPNYSDVIHGAAYHDNDGTSTVRVFGLDGIYATGDLPVKWREVIQYDAADL